MSWPESLGGDRPPSGEQLVLRLAYHLHQRTKDPGLAETVLQRAHITRKTLTRYSAYQPASPSADGDLHAAGPRRLDLYAAVCLAMGENPGKVMWAASLAGDYPSMLALLSAEVHLRPRLLICDTAGAPDSTAFELVPQRQTAGG